MAVSLLGPRVKNVEVSLKQTDGYNSFGVRYPADVAIFANNQGVMEKIKKAVADSVYLRIINNQRVTCVRDAIAYEIRNRANKAGAPSPPLDYLRDSMRHARRHATTIAIEAVWEC